MRCAATLTLLLYFTGVGASGYWTGSAVVGYDDNVFCYSPRDESSYLYRSHEGSNRQRFAGVRSLDDMMVDAGLRASWRCKPIKRHTTTLSLGMTGHQYLSNVSKSYLVGTVRIRQYWARGSYVEGNYLLIPRYLIRNYRNPANPLEFVPCVFTEHLGGLKMSLPVTNWLTLLPQVRYEFDRYGVPFTAYDSRGWRLASDVDCSCLRLIQAVGSYEYKRMQASGPYPDISYQQHKVGMTIRSVWRQFGFGIIYEYTGRDYTASRERDITHAGRVDRSHLLKTFFSWRLASRLRLDCEVGREQRDSFSPYRADIDEVKDYRRHMVRLGIRHGGVE